MRSTHKKIIRHLQNLTKSECRANKNFLMNHFFHHNKTSGAGRTMTTSFSSSQVSEIKDVPPPPSPEKPFQKKLRQFSGLLESNVVNLDKIREISWAGIPDQFRPSIWRLFLDYEPVNSSLRKQTLEHKRSDYFDCLSRVFGESQRHLWTSAQKQTQTQILRDLPRTHITLLRSKRVQDLFERVLFVWAVRHPASGYVQGMNDLLQPFFFVFLSQFANVENINDLSELTNIDFISDDQLKEIEADSFWCFSKLLDGLQDLYTKDQPGLYKMLNTLQQVIQQVDPQLSQWISSEEIEYQEFAFRWMNCLLVREFPMPLVLRLWDSYLSNHTKIASSHVYVCAAMMTALSDRIKGVPHAEFVMKVQQIEPNEWKMEDMDMIIAQAFVYENKFAQTPARFKSPSLPSLPR
ncbi:TBC domain containing protein [Tritrichomonas foetus]|uniref:TBC domain containing protein n=1 Tax=Tritrichomonas foetus TaxID=1144522 RepID=A0A1J4JGN2_9EUKA|nr:TBC domain containing protein [Tritrichomonas foetus]|eukprot:OHS96795.1 TBC domain containing protein [Tritrichomonas foetus]